MAADPPKIALILSISLFGGVAVFLLGISVWRHNLPLFLAMLFFPAFWVLAWCVRFPRNSRPQESRS
jgi:hypothetical protein